MYFYLLPFKKENKQKKTIYKIIMERKKHIYYSLLAELILFLK